MSTFRDRLNEVRANPTLMEHLVLNEISSQLEGTGNYDITDPGNPFVALLQASTLESSMAVDEGEALLRRLYPSMALTEDELYLHMSDKDYIGRFASPAWTTFELYLNKGEVLAKVLPTDNGDVRKLVIPRLTEFDAAGTQFTMQYPIEIRRMSHGGLQIVYDTEDPSPIQTLETNQVDWSVLRIDAQQELLCLKIPVAQFHIETYTEALNQAAGFDQDYGFADQFYYARVYLTDTGGQWREIPTTHTDQVYDPLRVTAVLKVTNGRLNVRIPQVYFSQNLARDEVRVDIYTTQGPIDVDFGGYQASQFQVRFNDVDDDSTFVSPLTSFNQLQALNPNVVSGGADGVTFQELRRQVITNALGGQALPITHAQLGTELNNRGYTVVTNIDNITNRQFLASRRLPSPDSDDIAGGIGCMMGQLQTSLRELVGSAHVRDNGERVTILPSMLYELRDGVVTQVTDYERDSYATMTPDGLARTVNQRRFLYSPAHYVLDTGRDNFDVRPYYLDSPEVVRKVFVAENDTAQFQIGADEVGIERTVTGYRLTVRLRSGTRIREMPDENVVVQLGYRPNGESSYASLNGTLIGIQDEERVYQFDIETNYDIDADDGLYTTNLSMFDEAQRDFATPLLGNWDLTFLVINQDTTLYDAGIIDDMISDHLLPTTGVMAVTRERVELRLGYALPNLWHRHRTIVTPQSYRRYADDVPYLYESTIFARNEDGQVIITPNGEGGYDYQTLHEKGDPVLDGEGNPRYRFLKGDVIMDDNGEPELISPRQLAREITLFLVDGTFYFANDEAAETYRQRIPETIVSWLADDVGMLQQRLLEQSELYLYPTKSVGDTTAVVKEGLETTIALEQSLYVNYYMSDTAYSNTALRNSLKANTRLVVSEMLARPTVAMSDIIARLKAEAGSDVISLEVGGLGGDQNYSTVSITDDAVRMGLSRRLVVLSNQLLTVQDDIDISFLRHSTQ